MKKLIFSLITLSALTVKAQVGDVFPAISATSLNEKEVSIPEDTKGKYTLIGVAFTEAAQEDLYTWSQPVYSEFLDENNFSSLIYDPYVHLVLMFTGANQLVFEKAKKRILDGSDETIKDNVLLYKGKMEDYRKTLDMKNRKIPYFFVLDKNGKIIYMAEGAYSAKILKEVAELIEND